MPTITEVLQYLGIDYADEVVTANVTRALDDAKAYLQSAVGADVFELLPDDPKVGRLVLTYLQELYDERGTTSAKAGNAKREMIHSMEWQLRLELARKREEAVGV
jgi:hypothetical protein